jgi:hypothetical protein
MVSLEFFSDIILPAALWPWGWPGLQQIWVPGIFFRSWRRPVRRADNLTTFMCRLSWNLGVSTSWNPMGLSRPVMGLLYLYLYLYMLFQYRELCDLVSVVTDSRQDGHGSITSRDETFSFHHHTEISYAIHLA